MGHALKTLRYLCLVEKTYSKSQLSEVAAWLWQQVQPQRVMALHGEMGTGKTTLIHAICDYLNVEDTVGSPTFSIINEYLFDYQDNMEKIFHIDLYRLKNEEEAIRAGVEDCFYSGAFCFVEWPEKAPALFPDDTLHVYISLVGDQKRNIKIAGK